MSTKTQLNPATFLSEVQMELTKERWPSRKQTINLTMVVIGVSIATGLLVGGTDAVLVAITSTFLK